MSRKRHTSQVHSMLPTIAVPLREPDRVGPGSRSPLDLAELLRYAVSRPGALVAGGLVLTLVWRLHEVVYVLHPLRLPAVFGVLGVALLLKARNRTSIRVAVTRPYSVALLLLFGWILVGVPMAMEPVSAWEYATDSVAKGLLFCLFLMSVLSRRRVLAVLVLVNLVGLAIGLVGYVRLGMQPAVTPYSMYDRNDMALLINVALPLVLWTALEIRSRWLKFACFALAALGAGSIIATTSRGGLLALALVSTVAMMRFKRLTLATRSALAVGLVLLFALAPSAYWDRMGTLLEIEEDYNVTSETGRLQIWERGWQYFLANPFTGVGVDNFQIAERTFDRPGIVRAGGKAPHNGVVQVLAETGIPGFAAWLGMILLCMAALRRAYRILSASPDPEDRAFAELCLAVGLSFLAYLVGGFFLSHAYATFLLQLVALTAGLHLIAERVSSRYVPVSRPVAVPHAEKVGRYAVGEVLKVEAPPPDRR